MAALAIGCGVAFIALSRIRPRLHRMIHQKVSPVHDLLNRIAPLVAVDAEKIVAVTLGTFGNISFCIILMFGNPARLVARRFWKTIGVTSGTVLRGRRRRVGVVMAGVAAQFVHLGPVSERVFRRVAVGAFKTGPFKKCVVHLVHLGSEKIKRMLQLFFRRNGC